MTIHEAALPLLSLAGSTAAWFLGRRMLKLDMRQKLIQVAGQEADTLENLLHDVRTCHELGRKMEADIDDLLRAQQRDKDTHLRQIEALTRHVENLERQNEQTLGELLLTKQNLLTTCDRLRIAEEWRIEHEKQHNGG